MPKNTLNGTAHRNGTFAPDALGEALRAEMEWLAALIDARIRTYFGSDANATDPLTLAPPRLAPGSSRYAGVVATTRAELPERVLLALALAPHVSPQTLDVFFLKNEKIDRGFTEFGGLKGLHHAGFLPTGDTALFLLAGDDLERRLELTRLFEPEHPLRLLGVLRLEASPPGEPAWSGALSFSPAYLRHLITGEEPRPEMGLAFPARPVSTGLTWDDLVLDAQILEEVNEIKAWAQHKRELLDEWGLARHLRPGFRALFHGPPGTGKTLTACLLGKELGVEVYRVDLSQVVSKYIGETEKNLAAVFAEAEKRNWILFFDEADALFGKRTQTASSHDRYANQEVSYLLQRVEEHPGIVILATNFNSNLDDAFSRCFHVVVYFAPPNTAQRRQLWKNCFGPRVKFESDVDFGRLGQQHELTGGQIINVVRRACLAAVRRSNGRVALADITQGIRHEFRKEGRNA